MNARRATAALSAAGIILIAGCGGGGKMGGTSLPPVGQGGLHNGTQPAKSSKIALKFMLPARHASAWTTPAYQPAYKQRRAKAFMPKKGRVASLRRKPQYLSEGLIGGSITISIYQGSNVALTQGPFTVGFAYGASDFYCAYVPAAGAYQCSNYSSVFAPLGNDTFYAVESNAAGQSLAATPDWPGTSYAQVAQSSYLITSSGYPTPISIQTYAIASYLNMDAPTSCIDPSNTPLVALAFLSDASGFPISGYLANPFTINVTGNFALYNLYAQQLTTPYTATYSNPYFNALEFAGTAVGNTGAVSVSSSAAAVGINLTSSTSRNLYAVDRLAISPSTSGINVVGLVDSGPSAFNCGTLPIASYTTGAAIAPFSNPVAIGEDDAVPGILVLDNVSGTPYVTAVDVGRDIFGDFLETGGLIDAAPAFSIQVAGHNPLALAVSPSAGASGNIYILNADGSIQTVSDVNDGVTSTLEPAGTVGGAVDISVFWNEGGSFNGDYVFATSSNSASLYQVSNADTSPALTTFNLTSGITESPQLISPTTYAVSADNIDGFGYISFLAFDNGNGNTESLVTCLVPSCFGAGDSFFSYSAVLGQGQTTFNYTSSSFLTALVANGNNVASFVPQPFASPTPSTAPFPAFGSTVTQMVTTYDGLWEGVGAGSAFKFFYNLGASGVGSLSGTHATIVSPFYQQLL